MHGVLSITQIAPIECPAFTEKRRARQKTPLARAGHHGVVCKPFVDRGVRDNHALTLRDNVRAYRRVLQSLGGRQSNTRLDPLPILIDERDRRYRCAKRFRGERRKIIEC